MKTFRKLAFIVLLVLLGSNAFAIDPVVTFTGVKKITVNLNNVNEKISINFRDTKGISLYSEDIKKSTQKFSKTFDVSDLPDGLYKVEIEDGIKISSYSFSVISNKILSGVVKKDEIFKPVFAERGKKVYVSKYNPQNTELKVTILDSNSQELYSENFKGKESLGKIYDFSKIQGDYTILVSCDDKTYTQAVTIHK